MTDGNGRISLDLAQLLAPVSAGGLLPMRGGGGGGAPVMAQIRLWLRGCVYKGTVTVDASLAPGQIWMPASCKKAAARPGCGCGLASLEVVKTTGYCREGGGRLNRILVPLLEAGGVPAELLLARQARDFRSGFRMWRLNIFLILDPDRPPPPRQTRGSSCARCWTQARRRRARSWRRSRCERSRPTWQRTAAAWRTCSSPASRAPTHTSTSRRAAGPGPHRHTACPTSARLRR